MCGACVRAPSQFTTATGRDNNIIVTYIIVVHRNDIADDAAAVLLYELWRDVKVRENENEHLCMGFPNDESRKSPGMIDSK